MKKFAAGLVKKRASEDVNAPGTKSTPEENASRSVRLFCESGGPNNLNGETQEYLHLPTIVESAESSPIAAKAAAYQIRKLLKDNYQKPYIQYNAIMLIRILADNPGPSFTKNIDDKFRQTIQSLLQQGRDPSVQQILSETLQALETEKAHDENLAPLMAVWQKERSVLWARQNAAAPAGWQAGRPTHQSRPREQRQRSSKHLPPPAELAARIEEGRMSAQLLTQVTQSTPAAEILASELAREFAERCQNAQRNLQGYMSCTDPAPDEQTFQTLIETCDALNVAMSRHQRAILAARRVATSPPPTGEPTSLSSLPSQLPVQAQPRGAPTAAAIPQPSTFSRNPYYTTNGLQPKTLQATAADRAVSRPPVDPFSDENQILSRAASDQRVPSTRQPAQGQDEPRTTMAPPASGTVELPLSRTPPLGPTSSGPLSSVPASLLQNNDDFQPPPGPPPNRQASLPLSTYTEERSARPPTQDSDDLYSTNSPVTDKQTSQSDAVHSPAREDGEYPASSAYHRQYPSEAQRSEGTASTNPFILSEPLYATDTPQPQSPPITQAQSSPKRSPPPPPPPHLQPAPYLSQSTPSYVRRQDAAVHDLAMSGGTSSPPTPAADSALAASTSLEASGSKPARIKDDEPVTPMSPEAWQSAVVM